MSFLQIAPPEQSVKINLSTTPTDGQVLVYNGTSREWEPGSAAGGSDPWTTIELATDFDVSTTAYAAVTGFGFTPIANKTYKLEMMAIAKAASTATGIRPGYQAMGGTIICGVYTNVPNGSSQTFIRNMFGVGANISAATASASATPHLVKMEGLLIAGAAPSGAFNVTLSTETAASAVTFMAGSFFRYREV